MSARAFVDAARSLHGAKWRHRGRKPWAVDCIGLVVLAAAQARLEVDDAEGYGREPWDDRLRRELRTRFGDPIPLDALELGDIAVFRWGKGDPSHVGIIGDHPNGGHTLIHAQRNLGVVECSLAGRYRDSLVEAYRPRFA